MPASARPGPKVGSFDAGYGSSLLARLVGDKKAKEIWFLCRQYSAQEALDMGLVNAVVPLDKLEETAIQWAREILEKSPTAIRFIKAAFNAATEGLAACSNSPAMRPCCTTSPTRPRKARTPS